MTMDRSKLQMILDAVPDMYFVLDGEGIVVDFKPSRTIKPAIPLEMFIGKPLSESVPPNIAKEAVEHVRQVLETGQERRMFYDLMVEDGKEHFEARLTHLGGGEVLVMVRDVTKEFTVDHELVESEARYRQLFEENPIPMYIYDMATLKIIDVNKAVIENYGYARDEIKTITIKDIRPPEDVEALLENVSDLRTGQIYLGEWRHVKKDGTIIDV